MSKLMVSYGPNELEITSGTAGNIAELRKQVNQIMNIPDTAIAELDGVSIETEDEAGTEIPIAAKEVTFVKESGEKA